MKTKESVIDSNFLKNIYPRRYNKFVFYPSDGASGGLLIVWNGTLFDGVVIDSNRFAITVQLTSLQLGQDFFLTNIYGPCSDTGKAEFTNWLYNYDASAYELWVVVGQ
jgi:hypothetical protein